jgi:hypothetical protein
MINNKEVNQNRIDKFYSVILPPDKNDCMKWGGILTKRGYARIRVNSKKIMAHRFSWMLKHGYIHDGLCVCHKCDNPSCVNPDHLFLAVHAINMADMANKGRIPSGKNHRLYGMTGNKNPWYGKKHNSHAKYLMSIARRGENNSSAKLNAEQILVIRESKLKIANLAKKYNVCFRTIWAAKRRITWKHI